jgi:hypothetical protein
MRRQIGIPFDPISLSPHGETISLPQELKIMRMPAKLQQK